MEMHTKEEKRGNVLTGHEEIILCVCVWFHFLSGARCSSYYRILGNMQ